MKKAGLFAVIVLASVFVFGTSVIAGDSKPAPAPAKPAPPAQRSAPAPAPAPRLAPAPAPAPTVNNYNVNTGNTTLRSQGGLNPAPNPVKPVTTISPAPASTPPAQTKVIMAPTWPVQVPVRVPANTPERPDNPHAGENVGAAQGLGGR